MGGKSEGEQGMPKRARQVVLSEKEQEALVQITKRHRSEQQQAQRARIVLAAGQGDSNRHIAREVGIDGVTVRLGREPGAGLRGLGLEAAKSARRLREGPRRGAA